MQIINYLDLFIGALISTLTSMIIVKNNFYKDYKKTKYTYIIILLFSAVICYINIIDNGSSKVLMIMPVMMLLIKLIFKDSMSKSFALTVVVLLYMFIPEILVAVIVSILGMEDIIFNNAILGSALGNILICISALLLLRINKLTLYFKRIFNWFNEKNMVIIFAYIALIVVAVTYKNYTYINNVFIVIIDLLVTALLILIVYFSLKEHQKTIDISNEYNSLLVYLNEYEKEITEKRKIIHDFNNELIIINEYADPKNKRLKQYLHTLMDNQRKTSSKSIISKLDNLPRGLRGLICYKLVSVQDSVKIIIEAEDDLKDYVISDDVLVDYLKVIGILIDNAVEAAVLCNNAEIHLNILEDNNILKLRLINTFNGDIDINKIFENGYSTKGTKRGYGLSVVKDIVKTNNKIKMTINVKDNTFIAELSLN